MNHKILLIDDDETFSISLSAYLEYESFDVIWVKDAKEALLAVEKQRYDLMLLDVDLPYMDGFTLIEKLLEVQPQTPILFVTAKIQSDACVHGLSLGAKDYIKKPFDMDELIARINLHISQRIEKPKFIYYKDIVYDAQSKIAKVKENAIHLTNIQLKLFDFFILNIGTFITMETLIELVYQNEESSENSIRTAISKIKKYGLLIKLDRTHGYILKDYPKPPSKR